MSGGAESVAYRGARAGTGPDAGPAAKVFDASDVIAGEAARHALTQAARSASLQQSSAAAGALMCSHGVASGAAHAAASGPMANQSAKNAATRRRVIKRP